MSKKQNINTLKVGKKHCRGSVLKKCVSPFFLIFVMLKIKTQKNGTYTNTNFGNYFQLHKQQCRFVSLQSLIMNSLMVHESELFVEKHEGEQCNGFRPHRWYSNGFECSLRIPHSRSGNFYPVLLGLIAVKVRNVPCSFTNDLINSFGNC